MKLLMHLIELVIISAEFIGAKILLMYIIDYKIKSIFNLRLKIRSPRRIGKSANSSLADGLSLYDNDEIAVQNMMLCVRIRTRVGKVFYIIISIITSFKFLSDYIRPSSEGLSSLNNSNKLENLNFSCCFR